MNKYLSAEQLKAYLEAGKAVEQWLSYVTHSEFKIIRWLRLDKEPNGSFTVAYFESFDDGNADLVDVYAFSFVDPDEPYGKLQTLETIDKAIEYCTTTFQASASNFVASGMIQYEYERYMNNSDD
jgi:hypothetical protein